MIEKIQNIKITGCYFTPSSTFCCFPNESNRVSIVYGKNGSGKSTFSKALTFLQSDLLCELYDSHNKKLDIKPNQINVFNEDFIRERVQLSSDGLEAIVLFGDDGKIEKELEKQNKLLETVINDMDSKYKTREILENHKNTKSYKYKSELIKQKLKQHNNWVMREELLSPKRVNVSDKTIQSIFSITPKTKTLEEASNKFQKILAMIGTAKDGEITIDLKGLDRHINIFDNIESALAQIIPTPELTHRDKLILETYEKLGKSHITTIQYTFTNQKNAYCPYCFRDISVEEKNEILLGIENILSKKAEIHTKELQNLDKTLTNIIKQIDSTIDNAYSLKKVYLSDYEMLEASSKILNSILSEYSSKIEDKLNNIYVPINYHNSTAYDEYEHFNSIVSKLEEDRIAFNNQIKKIKEQEQLAKDYNKEIAYWEFKEDYNEYLTLLDEYKKCISSISSHEEKKKQIENTIDDLKDKKKKINVAKDQINEDLSYVFFTKDRLQLEIENSKYFLLSKGKKVKPDKISTGERNIIALCYFFTQILNNHYAKDNYSDEHLIVIDDPVSSFDLDNRVGVLTFLKRQISKVLHGNPNSRIILLTHDMQTVFDLEKASKELSEEFNCKKNFSNKLELKNLQMNNLIFQNRYSALMYEIYQYANGQSSELTEITIGNSMRRLLEAYGTFVYKKGIDALTTDEEILSLCDKYKEFYRNYMYRLVLNGESHFEDKVKAQTDISFLENYDYEQLRDTARKIISFIYLINPIHVKNHLSDKGNSLGNFEHVIESWLLDLPS